MTRKKATPDELAERRAIKAGDPMLWTPKDAILSVIRDIENGTLKPTKIAIHYTEEFEGGKARMGYIVAGLTFEEHVVMLESAKIRALNRRYTGRDG